MLTRRVLVATDFSETADLALIEAHERAGQEGALLVCYARSAWSSHTRPGTHAAPLESQSSADLREALIDRMVSATGRAKDQFTVAVDDDEPYASIVKRAESWDADLVVVGYRGASGLSRVWLGGVAEKVARLAHCPVLVVRPKPGTRRIVAGTDFSDPALPAIRAAYDEAERVGGKVILTHCLEMPLLLPDAAGLTGAEVSAGVLDEIEAEATRRLEAAMTESPVPAEFRLTRERPSTALVRLADAIAADLVVVGTRGRTGISRVLLGSVAEAVVRSATCSVLVVRLHDAPATISGP
jgi:nucleotide-binding universal stress UspA family protein